MLHLFISLIILSFYVISFIDHGRPRNSVDASPFNSKSLLTMFTLPNIFSAYGNFESDIYCLGENSFSYATSLHSKHLERSLAAIPRPPNSAMIFFFSSPATTQADPASKQFNNHFCWLRREPCSRVHADNFLDKYRPASLTERKRNARKHNRSSRSV